MWGGRGLTLTLALALLQTSRYTDTKEHRAQRQQTQSCVGLTLSGGDRCGVGWGGVVGVSLWVLLVVG